MLACICHTGRSFVTTKPYTNANSRRSRPLQMQIPVQDASRLRVCTVREARLPNLAGRGTCQLCKTQRNSGTYQLGWAGQLLPPCVAGPLSSACALSPQTASAPLPGSSWASQSACTPPLLSVQHSAVSSECRTGHTGGLQAGSMHAHRP